MKKWGLPGGKLEQGETLRECAERECLEEAGLRVRTGDLIFISHKPYSREGNSVVRFIYSAELLSEDTAREMEYQFLSQIELKKLAQKGQIRGKDIVKLTQDFFAGNITAYNQEPQVLS